MCSDTFRITASLVERVFMYTVEPVLKDCPTGHKNVVSQERWSLWWQVQLYWHVGPSDKNMWSFKTGGLMAVVSQDRFHYSLISDHTLWSDSWTACLYWVEYINYCTISQFLTSEILASHGIVFRCCYDHMLLQPMLEIDW